MKKINYFFVSTIIILFVNACVGYEPIFKSENLNFKIVDYEIKGDQRLGKRIYNKLYNFSKSNNNTEENNIFLSIKVLKNKQSTAKDRSGKILEYKINLNIEVVVKDVNKNNIIISINFNSSISYKAQNQFSETLKLENQSLNSLIENTYKDLLIVLSE
jgi:outer membrane lipopolysaccharide assembly protein LptE/RlpB